MKLMRSVSILLAFCLIFSLTGCMIEDDAVEIGDAMGEIYAAINYKERECGHKPQMPLILFEKPTLYKLQLCSISIIRMDCAEFKDGYPLFCWEIYNIDIPGIGP